MAKKLSNRAQRRKLERSMINQKAISNKDIAYLIIQCKYIFTEKQKEVLINNLSLNFLPELFLPKKYSELRKIIMYIQKNVLIKELIWVENIIIQNASLINKYLRLKDLYERYFLLNEYDLAKNTIDLIEKNICISNWSIEQKLLLAEYSQGFKENKEVLGEILDQIRDPLSKILIKNQSIRVEKNLSANKYREIIGNYVLNYKNKPLENYLTYKLDFFGAHQFEERGFFMSMDSNSSIIDQYESLLTIICLSISDKEGCKELKGIEKSVNCLISVINDKRLNNILLALGKTESLSLNSIEEQFIRLLDLYTNGKYNEVIVLGKNFILENPSNINMYIIYIKSLIYEGIIDDNLFENECIAKRVFKNLYNIVSKNEYTQTSLSNLDKIITSVGLASWTYNIYSFLVNENLFLSYRIDHLLFESIYTPYFNPNIITNIKNHNTAFNISNSILEYIQSDTVKLMTNIVCVINNITLKYELLNISPFREKLYLAESLCVKRDIDNALPIYENLVSNETFEYESQLPYNFERIVLGKIICYLAKNSLHDAISLITEANIANENLRLKFHSQFLIDMAIRSEDTNIIKDISTPIFLYQYNIKDNDLWIAYDNFLVAHNILYPHEIETIIDSFDFEKVIYFLNNICIKSVYDSSFLYNNQNELDNQRIEMCLLLTKLDKDHANNYIEEISEIDRDILIRKGIQQIDESKIYADTVGIKTSLDKELKETFNRYVELAAIPLDQIEKIDSEIGDLLVFFLEKGLDAVVEEFNPSDFKVTSYNRFIQFTDMFYKIRDKFISSNDYGLETYLSMRIRHGTLLGVIRSIFELRHLVTKKDSISNKYNSNTYWLNKFSFLENQNDIDRFNKIMSDFSFSIDNISDEFKNKSLQIKVENKESEGLFDYSYNNNSDLLILFQEKLGALTDYNEFIDRIIDELWNKTEKNLSNIRNYISVVIKKKITDLLYALNHDLDNLINKNEHPEVIELIGEITRCQTAISLELDRISEWFKRSNNKTINDFDIKLPLEACLVTTKRIETNYVEVEPKLTISSDARFDGAFLAQFMDIMHILIGNIMKHASLSQEELIIEIYINQDENNNLSIKISNNISETYDLNTLNGKINECRILLSQKVSMDKTRKEDGSGYLKLKKVLSADLKRDNFEINILDVDTSYVFQTEIIFNINGLEKTLK